MILILKKLLDKDKPLNKVCYISFMKKVYRSNEELITILRSKGISIKNKKRTIEYIEKYTYYSTINTYKNAFKKNNKYIDGVEVEEIFALFEFDKYLREIVLKYSLEIELMIKSLLANLVARKYGVKDYLRVENLDETASKDKRENLCEKIKETIKDNYKKHQAITHYIDKYNFIPPFVLVKVLTMGTISRYYNFLKQKDRQEISKCFNISDKLLIQILYNITLVRNTCCHLDLLYSRHTRFFVSFNIIDKTYKTSSKNNETNMYMIMRCMQCLLSDKDGVQLENKIKRELRRLSKKIKTIDINIILDAMGYPDEYNIK